MTSPTIILTALQREVSDARARNLLLKRIRVTDDAIPGSLTTVPIGTSHRMVEIVIHPEDWDGREWVLFGGIPVIWRQDP